MRAEEGLAVKLSLLLLGKKKKNVSGKYLREKKSNSPQELHVIK